MNFNDETKVKDIALSNPAARQFSKMPALTTAVVAGNHCMKRAYMQMLPLKKS